MGSSATVYRMVVLILVAHGALRNHLNATVLEFSIGWVLFLIGASASARLDRKGQ